jgi:class 3 adenylate cyclase
MTRKRAQPCCARMAERRQAAVLSADVVGYSGLMEADEAGTMARLKQLTG